jgi:hypothetical protein
VYIFEKFPCEEKYRRDCEVGKFFQTNGATMTPWEE